MAGIDTGVRGSGLLHLAGRIRPPSKSLLRLLARSGAPNDRSSHRTPELTVDLNSLLSVLTVLPPPPSADAKMLLMDAVTESMPTHCSGQKNRKPALLAPILINHLGRIALWGLAPKAMAKAHRLYLTTPQSRTESQRQVMGIDETVVGRQIARRWGLSAGFVRDTAPRYTQPGQSNSPSASDRRIIARFADAWTRGCLIDQSQPPASSDPAGAGGLIDDPTDPVGSLAALIQRQPEYGSIEQHCRAVADWMRRAFRARSALCALKLESGDLVAANQHEDLSALDRDQQERAQWETTLRVMIQSGAASPNSLIRAPKSIRRIFAQGVADDEGDALLLGFAIGQVAGGAIYVDRPQLAATGLINDRIIPIATMLGAWFDAALQRMRVEQSEDILARCANVSPQTRALRPDQPPSAVMARMAAGAAHELNNPLTVISGRAQLLMSTINDPTARKNLEAIRDQARRASGMVNELIETAKPHSPAPECIYLSDLAERTRQYWYQQNDAISASCQIDLSDRSAQVWADPDQLEGVLRAIVDNALDAGESGNIHLKIESPSVATDETIVLSVSDDGRGMTPDVAANAFDPFFSFREAGRKRGLGLTRALRLTEANGGAMWIETAPKAGTTVHVALPSAALRHTPHAN